MTEITPLARHIYRHLVRTARRGTASITYSELVAGIGNKFTTHTRSPKLYEALTEVTVACRERDLPAVTAIVWSAGAKRPSDGYYKIAYPRVRSFKAQVVAWREEHARVLRDIARLPGSL